MISDFDVLIPVRRHPTLYLPRLTVVGLPSCNQRALIGLSGGAIHAEQGPWRPLSGGGIHATGREHGETDLVTNFSRPGVGMRT